MAALPCAGCGLLVELISMEVVVVFVVSNDPAAAPELADSTEPDPLMVDPLSGFIERCRIEVVSAVRDVLVPVSRVAGLPMRSLLLLLHPTRATNKAVVNKHFFISSFLCDCSKGRGRKPVHMASPFRDIKNFDLLPDFQYGEQP